MPTAPRTDGGLWSPGRRALTIGLILTVTIVASEALAISTIMPVVADDLAGGSRTLYGWVFSAFLLSSLVGIVLAGLLIDRGSLATAFIAGLSLFCVGLVIGGAAPTMEVLVAGRALQGLGAGAVPAVAYVAIGRALPEHLRPTMFATLSTAWVLPGVLGPFLAGVVAELFHWRFVFLGLLPLAAIAAAMTVPAIRSVRDAAGTEEVRTAAARMSQRLPLAFALAIGSGLMIAGLTDARLVPGLPLFVVGLLLAFPTFRRLTPPGTLRAGRGLPAAVLLRGLLTFAFFSADVYVTLALEDWRGLSPILAGVALMGATLSWTAGAWIQARVFQRLGARPLVRLGFAVVAVGIVLFSSVLNLAVPVLVGVAAWTIAGLGMGLSYAPLSLTVLREAPLASQGAATAGLQLSDVLGTSLGAGVGGALVAFGHREGHEEWVGLGLAFAVGVVVAGIGFALAGRLSGTRDHRAVAGASVGQAAEPIAEP
jgi:MFS family permease